MAVLQQLPGRANLGNKIAQCQASPLAHSAPASSRGHQDLGVLCNQTIICWLGRVGHPMPLRVLAFSPCPPNHPCLTSVHFILDCLCSQICFRSDFMASRNWSMKGREKWGEGRNADIPKHFERCRCLWGRLGWGENRQVVRVARFMLPQRHEDSRTWILWSQAVPLGRPWRLPFSLILGQNREEDQFLQHLFDKTRNDPFGGLGGGGSETLRGGLSFSGLQRDSPWAVRWYQHTVDLSKIQWQLQCLCPQNPGQVC